jgi:hypothetical protein
MPARVIDQVTGRMFNVALEEGQAFWEWAIVETLRHSGVRIEELSELTHLSIRQYRRPNSEVAALLVIAPSKTDRERVIPMPAGLFAVIAAIIRRHLRRQPTIPLLPRYDKHERVWSKPMPFLSSGSSARRGRCCPPRPSSACCSVPALPWRRPGPSSRG